MQTFRAGDCVVVVVRIGCQEACGRVETALSARVPVNRVAVGTLFTGHLTQLESGVIKDVKQRFIFLNDADLRS